jgi:hypothetical protein
VNFISHLAGNSFLNEGYRRVQNRSDGFDVRPSDFDCDIHKLFVLLAQLYLSPGAQHYRICAILATQMAAGALCLHYIHVSISRKTRFLRF